MTTINLVALLPQMMEQPAAERDLIERSKTDRDALAILYRKYLPTITAYVVRRIGNSSEAEDVVSNVFLAMVRGLSRYRCTDTPFAAWLYRIATNEINRSIRKRRVRNFFGLGETIVDRNEPVQPQEKLRLAMSELPIHFQTALSLYYLEELSIEDIAVVLGVAQGTVKSRLARGRDLLRQKLGPENA